MKAEKQFLFDEIQEKIDSSKGFIVTRYKGVKAGVSRSLRRTLKSVGGDFEVVQKRIFSKVASENGCDLSSDELQGHIGIIFAFDDILKIAKSTVTFNKENNNVLEIVAGHIDGSKCSRDEVIEISKLPSFDEIRALFISVLEAPMTGVVGTMNAVLNSVLYCLEEKSKQEQQN